MDKSRPLFVYFCPFLITISIIQSEKSVDGVLEIRTRGHRMVGHRAMTVLFCLLFNDNISECLFIFRSDQ